MSRLEPLAEDGSVTQVDAATAFVADHEGTVRHNIAQREWFTFTAEDGWRPDPYGVAIQECVEETLDRLAAVVPTDLSSVQGKRFPARRKAAIRKLETEAAMASIARIAGKKRPLLVRDAALDASPQLLGVSNGLLNLATGKLVRFTPGLMVTRRIPHAYEPEALCPRWERFLEEVLGQDAAVQEYIQMVIGYMLTGETTMQQMWVMTGDGSNGKSTLLRVLQEVLGPEYSQQAPESVLLGKVSQGGATSELARLKGVRLSVLTETDHGQAFNQNRVKSLVSGDAIAARKLYQEFVEFYPQAKFVLATNHLPQVVGSDDGIWRRLIVVPFNQRFAVGADPTLMTDLRDELPGILAWAVRGAVAWYARGKTLTLPDAFEASSQDYRREQDTVSAFIADATVRAADEKVTLADLFAAYQCWCDDRDLTGLDKTEFGKRVERAAGCEKRKQGKAHKVQLFGIRLAVAGGQPDQDGNDEDAEPAELLSAVDRQAQAA